MAEKLSAVQIESIIHQFWHAFVAKDTQKLQRFYSPGATVFNSSSSRHELGPVCAARRHREYCQRSTAIQVRLGKIWVDTVGEHAEAAIATYTFQFHATGVVTATGVMEEDIQLGRASQVFARTGNDICIVHEHLSLPAWPFSGASILPTQMPEYCHSIT